MKLFDLKMRLRAKGAIRRVGISISPKLWEWAYRRFRLSRYRRAGVVFCHIPKNGGSHVCSQLYGTNLGHIPAWQQIRELAEAGVTDMPVIAFVQDPVKRFCSSASHFFSRGGEHSTLAWKESYDSIKTLSQLIDFACAVPDKDRNPILKSQHYYLSGAADLAAASGIEFRIYPLSQLDQVIAEFLKAPAGAGGAGRQNRSPLSADYRRKLQDDAVLRGRVLDLYRDDLRYLPCD